jgi:SAM-dependent methyltransferase
MLETDRIRDEVRAHYAEAARVAADRRRGAYADDACCPPSDKILFAEGLYDATDRASVPEAALLASLGCGNPIAVAELREGETVLDLGSGGGIDVLLSARRVGPSGRAYGVDMTDEMLELARRNAAEAGATNVEFLKGTIEAIPLPGGSVDVVISNCVINLSVDKPAVFREIARVLRPGGRVGVSDVVADDALDPDERAERGSHVGCIAGALSFSEYRAGLESVGLTGIDIVPTTGAGAGLHSAIVRATKPADWTPDAIRAPAIPIPSPRNLGVLDGGCTPGGACCSGDGCC